jgi:hypothetical protein
MSMSVARGRVDRRSAGRLLAEMRKPQRPIDYGGRTAGWFVVVGLLAGLSDPVVAARTGGRRGDHRPDRGRRHRGGGIDGDNRSSGGGQDTIVVAWKPSSRWASQTDTPEVESSGNGASRSTSNSRAART